MTFAHMLNAASSAISMALKHPLNNGLLNGTLPRNNFRFLIEQDYLYLPDFSKTLMRVSNKLHNIQHANILKKLSENALETQRNMYMKYLKEPPPLRLFQTTKFPLKKIPATVHYTNHLVITADTASAEEGVATHIACYFLYLLIGKELFHTLNLENPYHSWMLSYSSERLKSSTEAIIQIADELGHSISCPLMKKKIADAFVKSIECEILLWDSVCKKNGYLASVFRHESVEIVDIGKKLLISGVRVS
ncbi:MAG TPA: hypothetical protein VLI69_02235 [Gammaproteobacteria bacterium]|nr:hypothetical protein [Gammaproteobacteria bacterium]